MPNRLTRVPESPAPSLSHFRWLVALADLAMKCFFSTPASGTLESTWVTPATLWTSYLAAVGLIVIAVLCATELSVDLATWVVVLIAAASGVLAVACAAIAAIGTLQRILSS
jgi:hypothetical protein